MSHTLKKCAAALLLSAALLWGTAPPAAAAWALEDFGKAANANLLINPGFEDGETSWSLGGTAEITEAAAYSGGVGARLSGGSTIRQTIHIADAGDYTFNMAMQGDGENESLEINVLTGGEPYCLKIRQFRGSWEQISQTFTIPQALAGSDVTLEIVQNGWTELSLDDLWFGPSETLPPPLDLDMEENAVSNPDFETGIDGWESGDSGTMLEHMGGENTCMLAYSTNFSQTVYTPLSPDLPEGEVEITAYLIGVFLTVQGECSLQLGVTTNPSSIENATAYISIPSHGTEDGWLKVSFTTTLSSSEDTFYLVATGHGGYAYLGFVLDTVSAVPTHQTLPPPAPQRMLQNPGFETSLSGWTQQGSPTAFATDGQAYSGTQSAYFGYFASAPMQNYIEQTVAAGAGNYAFSAMVKPDATLQGVGCMLMLEALDKNGAVLATVSSPAVSDPAKGWQKTGATLTAPAGTASLRLKIGGIYCTGAFYVDDTALLSL